MRRQSRAILGGFLACLLLVLSVLPLQAQQMPIPKTAAQVPGPAPGTAMTREYVQMVGRMAYFWGWPLVNLANRAKVVSVAVEPVIMGGMPVGSGRLAMLTTYSVCRKFFPQRG